MDTKANLLPACYVYCLWWLLAISGVIGEEDASHNKTVKKAKPPGIEKVPPDLPEATDGKVVVISERTLEELQGASKSGPSPQQLAASSGINTSSQFSDNVHQSHLDEFRYALNNDDVPAFVVYGFYFLLAFTILALVVMMIKLYRMRFTRAELKYGVQGQNNPQELTPLPGAIEFGSDDDDEDLTMFDINSHEMRVF